jgi:hypothetical protein
LKSRIFQGRLKGREYSNRAERDANLEGIKVKFSQRGSQVMEIIKNIDVYSKFIHVGFFAMQQFTLSLLNESLDHLTINFLKLIPPYELS